MTAGREVIPPTLSSRTWSVRDLQRRDRRMGGCPCRVDCEQYLYEQKKQKKESKKNKKRTATFSRSRNLWMSYSVLFSRDFYGCPVFSVLFSLFSSLFSVCSGDGKTKRKTKRTPTFIIQNIYECPFSFVFFWKFSLIAWFRQRDHTEAPGKWGFEILT